MTDFNPSPPNATPVSTLPHENTLSDGERLLAIKTDGSLKQLLASSLLAPKGEKGDTGAQGPPGLNGKDATAPALTILPYYDTTPPDGYLFLCGQNFDRSQYPLLAKIFPTGALPDFRDRVLRGAGDFIKFGEIQEDAIRDIQGFVNLNSGDNALPNGCFQHSGNYNHPPALSTESTQPSAIVFAASYVVPTANENRVKSVGIHFIIKAA